MSPVERAMRFMNTDVWMASVERMSRARRALYQSVRIAYITIEGFADDLCTTRAAALTFTTLLSLVPVFALTLAVLRGLGWRGARLESIILDRVTLLSPEAIDTVVSYVAKINFTGLGVLGAALLFVTFISLVTTIESAFNAIWDHAPSRTIGRRVTDYFGVMLIAPILFALALSLTTAVQSNFAFSWVMQTWGLGTAARAILPLAAWVVVWLLFGFLYLFVPNTRVRLVPAFP